MKFIPSLKLKKIHLLTSLHILTIVVTVAIMLAIAGVGLFLYTYFYRTIAQSEEIILLRQEVAPESINITQVKQAIANIEKKETTPPPPERYRNPFSFVETLPPPSTTTTSTPIE